MQVEFYGVARQRAGRAQLELTASTLGALVQTLAAEFPDLAELIDGDRLDPVLVASLNGDRFVRDPLTPLADRDCVLILSADAGG